MNNDDIFTTEGIPDPTTGYESLEVRIVNWDWRQSDVFGEDQEVRLVRKNINIRSWQKAFFDRVVSRMGVNYSKAMRCAYAEGQGKLSRLVGKDEVEEYEEFIEKRGRLTEEYNHISRTLASVSDQVNIDSDIDDPFSGSAESKGHGEIVDNIGVMILPNHKAYIDGTWATQYGFGGWIHRAVVSLGVDQSENKTRLIQQHTSDVEDEILRLFRDSRRRRERAFNDYIKIEADYWIENGIHENALEDMMELQTMMNTQNSFTTGKLLERVAEQATVIDSDDTEYERVL